MLGVGVDAEDICSIPQITPLSLSIIHYLDSLKEGEEGKERKEGMFVEEWICQLGTVCLTIYRNQRRGRSLGSCEVHIEVLPRDIALELDCLACGHVV